MKPEEILEAAKEAGLYMTSPERIAAVERLVAIIERRNSDRIEQLQRQLAERDAEIAKYRDAPVVSYVVTFSRTTGENRLIVYSRDSAEKEVDAYLIRSVKPLIVKPGEQ